MRIAALFFGLIAGLVALVAPVALKTDLLTPFLELWAHNPSERLLSTIAWYAVPGAALLGGLIAMFAPGFAALLLLAAAAGWVGIGLMLPSLLDIQLLGPAAASALAAALAFVAGELQLRQKRQRRRSRRGVVESLVDDDEFEREAALRIDPLVVPRDEVPPPPKRAIPLTLDDVSVSEKPSGSPPRWQDLDAAEAPRRSADMWAEAIRPEPEEPAAPEYVPEPEPAPEPVHEPEQQTVPEPEPFISPRRGPTVRGFTWGDDDMPPGQQREPVPPPGPKLEPRRPAPGPQFQQRRPEPAHEARQPEPAPPPPQPRPEPVLQPRAEPRRPAPQPPPEPYRPEPAPEALPREEAKPEPPRRPLRAEADRWPEPQIRRPMPVVVDEDDPPRSGLVSAAIAGVAVLIVGAMVGGGYLAYREGWLGPATATTAQVAPQDASAPATGTASVAGAKPASGGPTSTVTNVAASAPAGEAQVAPGAVPAPPGAAEPATEPTTAAPQTVADATPPVKTFADPFTYCRSVGTLDYVDSRYVGPPTVEAITRALSLPDTASRDRVRWRCVRGAVLACTSYGGPVCDMTPSVDEMRAFCSTNQNVGQLLAPSGTWSCVNGQPELPAAASWPVDERGFLPNVWVVVRPSS